MIDKVKKLNVKYNDKLVGYLVDLEDGRIAFQYDDEWINTGFSISPFSLPLDNKVFINPKMNFDLSLLLMDLLFYSAYSNLYLHQV